LLTVFAVRSHSQFKSAHNEANTNLRLDKFMRETEPIPALLVDILRRLSQDSSPSVKMYISESAALLGGISARGEKPAPAILSQPTRSRHFSKPPVSRHDDHLSIDGHGH